MRLVLPVEYDLAAAAVRDAIARCAPRAVVSFGQGGGAIALEETAYNLKDTGEVSGGVPDNRGVIAAALPIDRDAPAERSTSLPLGAIDHALRALGESPQRSDDPGRYICNNVFFTSTGLSARAGFVHLPYTTRFDDAERARWGRVALAVVQATADSL
jgi:pyroglutamyl-peptidase